ncbi:MAG: hypothetical protein ACE366_29815 [Bradymonadia bacterium]
MTLLHSPILPSPSEQAQLIDARGGETLLSICQLIRAVANHEGDREQTIEHIRATLKTLTDLARQLQAPVSFAWSADGACRLCGRLLLADESTWRVARRMGGFLRQAGVSTLNFAKEVREQALVAFAQAFIYASEGKDDGSLLRNLNQPHLEVQLVGDAEALQGIGQGTTLHRLFARTVVEIEACHDALVSGIPGRSPTLSRLTHQIAGLIRRPLTERPHLALWSLMPLDGRLAWRAAQTGILMALMTERLSKSRDLIACMAHMGMLSTSADLLHATRGRIEAPNPALHAGVMLSAGGLTAKGLVWSQNALEAARAGTASSHENTQSLPGRMLYLCRQYIDGLYAPAPADRTPASILRNLSRTPDVAPDLLKLLISSVGIIPIGSPVLLQSGAWAVVTARSHQPDALQRPQIRIITDTKGHPLPKGIDLDLGTQAVGTAQEVHIVRPLSPDEATFNPLAAITEA